MCPSLLPRRVGNGGSCTCGLIGRRGGSTKASDLVSAGAVEPTTSVTLTTPAGSPAPGISNPLNLLAQCLSHNRPGPGPVFGSLGHERQD